MSKRPRSDYETGDDATRAGLDPKSDGGGLLAEYIPCRTFQGSRPGYYFKLDAKESPRFLEINPLPTFAPDGSFGILAELAGRSYADFVGGVLAEALERLGLPR